MPSIGRMLFLFAFMASLLLAIEWLAYRLVERQWREEPSWVLIKRTWVLMAVVIWLAFIVNGFVLSLIHI